MKKPIIICFGEVLWDLLPTGKVAGGAPMNVAFHAQQFGLKTYMISKVGNDELGHELLAFLNEKGISTELVQTDFNFKTGVVNVHLDNGSPSYEIAQPVAWDFIHADTKTKELVQTADAVVFGSLAMRSETNRQTLSGYLENSRLKVFDVNLRPPFYSQELLEHFLLQADIVKMNDEELEVISGWNGWQGSEGELMEATKKKYGLQILILTRGAKGAGCMDENGFYEHGGFPVTVEDTIGSGDSFLAGFMSQFLKGIPLPECLEFAAAVGAMVATKRGGTPELSVQQIRDFIGSNK